MADNEEVFSDEEMFSACSSRVLKLALSRFTRTTQRRKHKRKHKLNERFPFLVFAFMLSSSPAVYTLVSCASACVVRLNQPLGLIIFIDLVVD